LAKQRIERNIADGRADGRTIIGHDAVDVVHRLPPATRRHVLDDDLGMARDVAADVPGEEAAILGGASTHRRADEQVDLLAAVEVARRLSRGDAALENADQNRCRCSRVSHDYEALPSRRLAGRLGENT